MNTNMNCASAWSSAHHVNVQAPSIVEPVHVSVNEGWRTMKATTAFTGNSSELPKGISKKSTLCEDAGVGIMTLIGRVCVQVEAVSTDMLVKKQAMVIALKASGSLEYFADRKRSNKIPMPAWAYTIMKEFNSFMAGCGVLLDTMPMKAFRAALGKSFPGELHEVASKKLYLQLEDRCKGLLKKAAIAKGISVMETPAGLEISVQMNRYHLVFMKAQYEAGVIAADALVSSGVSILKCEEDELASKAKVALDTVPKGVQLVIILSKLIREAGSNLAKSLKVNDSPVGRQAAWDAYHEVQALVVATLRESSAKDVEELVVANMLVSIGNYGLFMSSLKKMKAALTMLETKCSVYDAVGEVFPELLEEGSDVARAEVLCQQVAELAESGMYKVGEGRNIFIADPSTTMFSQLDYLGTKLCAISGSIKKGDSWYALPNMRIEGRLVKEWWVEQTSNILGGNIPSEGFRKVPTSLLGTVTGDGVEYNTLPYTGEVQGLVTEDSCKVGSIIKSNFSPDGKELDTVTIRVISESLKTAKRLGVFGGSYAYGIDISSIAINIIDDPCLQHEAHEGRGFMHTETAGLEPGIYVCARALLKILGLLKFVLEVGYQFPKGELNLTVGSTKNKEIEVLEESKWLMVGYKHDVSHVRTNKSWLARPELVAKCAKAEMDSLYVSAKDNVVNAIERMAGTVPCIGAMSMAAKQSVGNAENAKECRFDMSKFGVTKVYARAATKWDKLPVGAWNKTTYGAFVMWFYQYEKLAAVGGGADSDDSYTMQDYGEFFEFCRDPHIGLEWFQLSKEVI